MTHTDRQKFIDWVDVQVIADEIVISALQYAEKKETLANAKKVWLGVLQHLGENIDDWVDANRQAARGLKLE